MRYITWAEVQDALFPFDQPQQTIYGVPKGGMIACSLLQHARVTTDPNNASVILDDLVDSGATSSYYQENYPHASFEALFYKESGEWLVLPWESDHPSGEDNIHENIVRQLQYIGEDPNREGLEETPSRVVRSWDELFAGYNQCSKDLLTTFDTDGYDQIVLCKNVEMFSMCEHHILPFYGTAHIAYIPDGRVIGISKLARLLDVYARRLQIQERIGQQVTSDLMNYLQPAGTACIIEATHMCMRMRGCSKQRSTMVTSSVKGVFYDKPEARQELMELIK